MMVRTYLRVALLLLLKENEGHGYELVARLVELGLDPGPTGTIYRLLRAMEGEGLVSSVWDIEGSGGPARRVYQHTAAVDASLAVMMDELADHKRILDAVTLMHAAQVKPVMASGEPPHS